MDCSLPGSCVHGILQARVLEWVAIAFSNRRIKGESKGERQIQPVISSLSVLHSLEHTKRFTELGRESRGREEIEVTWWRKRKVKRGRE